jgi:hypothetical protein
MCGGQMRPIAFITEGTQIRKISVACCAAVLVGTLMPYPSEDPTMQGGFFLIDGCFIAAPQFISD